MIHIVYESQAEQHEALFDSMYRHRAQQFKDRHDWDVTVDSNGHERDEYDSLDPMYLIRADAENTHLASMRFLPTIGSTMINDHFTELTGGVTVKSPLIWECTRFCTAPGAHSSESQQIMQAAVELGLRLKLQFYVGIFDRRMIKVYNRIGWPPVVVGQSSSPKNVLCAGLWSISEAARQSIIVRNGAKLIQDDQLPRVSEAMLAGQDGHATRNETENSRLNSTAGPH